MTQNPLFDFCKQRPLFVVLGVAICVALVKAVALGAGMEENFAKMGNDDILRMVMVRDWLAGQAWFDTTQYGMLPPEGVLIHWSRYIDAGIGALIVMLSWVLPMQTAELVAATIWPTLILVLLLLVVGIGTKRVFGTAAACFAVLCTVIWPLLADLHMRPGNLDHHNVQLLLVLVLVFTTIWPARTATVGVVGGLSAALSLAVGLENLLFIAVAGLVFACRAVFTGERRTLLAFCAALGFGSIGFWLGQTAPALRPLPICDQLGTPILSLVWLAVVASALPAFFLRGWPQLGAVVVLTVVGFIVAWPLLGPCLAGPYGDLPQAVQDYISTRITEAKPVIAYAIGQPIAAVVFLTPIFAALIFGGALWMKERGQALGILMVFCIFGVAVIFYQMRTFNMVAAVVPMIGGVFLARLLTAYLNSRDVTVAIGLLGAILLFVGSTTVAEIVRPLLPQTPKTGFATAGECRTYASLQSLNTVPSTRVLAHGNFGPSLLWATHHDALSGPYHRSPEALRNGIMPFDMQNAEMATYVRATDATHLLMCAGYSYQSPFSRALADGAGADWLVRVPVPDDAQVLYEILPE